MIIERFNDARERIMRSSTPEDADPLLSLSLIAAWSTPEVAFLALLEKDSDDVVVWAARADGWTIRLGAGRWDQIIDNLKAVAVEESATTVPEAGEFAG